VKQWVVFFFFFKNMLKNIKVISGSADSANTSVSTQTLEKLLEPTSPPHTFLGSIGA
jgi:hypothetical protein